MGNGSGDQSTRIPAQDYTAAFHNARMLPYPWTPHALTLRLAAWPTLGETISTNNRVVVMLDYGANQTKLPWLLDHFNYQCETPFSPTDPAFPCTQQRPANHSKPVSADRMYTINHNLNVPLPLFGKTFLLPAYSLFDEINAGAGNMSVGRNVRNCVRLWHRPLNWILVDYYDFGDFEGSVFEVAARANHVLFVPRQCCGSVSWKATKRVGKL